jgi:hypothetical protein
MSRAGLGPKAFRLLSSDWVAEWPASPTIDTSTISAGKIDSTA